jgi:PilZ domain
MLGENLNSPYESRATLVHGNTPVFNDTRIATRILPRSFQVTLRPSNSSQRKECEISGYCKNLSQSGCGVMATEPTRVGDIYRFEVPDETAHPLHGCHARCVRCHLLDEDAFEIGFSFLSPVNLAPNDLHAPNDSDPLA